MTNDIPGDLSDAPVGYETLSRVLSLALDQSARGKGKERHATGSAPFDRQPIMEIGRMVGPGGALFQAMKKAQEGMGMYNRREFDRANREFLGAIVYLAAAVALVEESAPAN